MSISEAQLESNVKAIEGARRKYQRPNPPRGVVFRNGLISWEPSADATWPSGPDFYRVYLDNENTLTAQVPIGQTSLAPPRAAARVFVSSYHSVSGMESNKVLLQQMVGIADTNIIPGGLTGTSLNLGTMGIGPNGSATFDNFVWTPNSPISGSVAYSAGTVNYKGVTYSVSAGSFDASHQVLAWKLSSPTILQQFVFPISLGVDDFIIGTSRTGTFQLCISLVGGDGSRFTFSSDVIMLSNQAGNLVGYWSNGNTGNTSSQIHITNSGTDQLVLNGGSTGAQITWSDSSHQSLACLVVPQGLMTTGKTPSGNYLKLVNVPGFGDFYVPLYS